MGSHARYALAILFALCCATTSFCAQSQTARAKKSPSGTISGKVTIKGKGTPGIVVTLRAREMNNPYGATSYKATTDQDGNYHIIDVPAGNYQVVTVAPAFVLAEVNNPQGMSVVLGEAENVEDINFSLVRGGVITGKVTDADGRALVQQQVSIYRVEPAGPRNGNNPVAYPAANTLTDDRGIYRMFGITAGRFRVAAGQGDNAFSGVTQPGRPSYRQVFHPDVTDPAKATIIEVSEGSEAKDVDIALGHADQTFAASGRVVDGEKGLPLPNVRIGVERIRGENHEFTSRSAASNSQGDFRIESLPPGKYGVFLFPEPGGDMRADSVTFDIVDQDFNGLTVKAVRGASLSGMVVLESEDKNAWSRLTQLHVQVSVSSRIGGSGFGQSGAVGADGGFRVGGLQTGTANFSLGGVMDRSLLKGFSISRVERDGVVQPRGVEIREGEQLTGLRLVVSYGTATLRGVVNLENGTLPAGGSIFVRLVKLGDSSSFQQPSSVVDARGHFIAEGLASGLYELYVYVSVPVESARRPPPVKQQVNLQDGTITDVTVTVDLDAKTGPNSP